MTLYFRMGLVLIGLAMMAARCFKQDVIEIPLPPAPPTMPKPTVHIVVDTVTIPIDTFRFQRLDGIQDTFLLTAQNKTAFWKIGILVSTAQDTLNVANSWFSGISAVGLTMFDSQTGQANRYLPDSFAITTLENREPIAASFVYYLRGVRDGQQKVIAGRLFNFTKPK